MSTQLRVVFNLACQYQGVSLNSSLCKDPCLIGNPLGVHRAAQSGGSGGQLPPPGKLNFFFFNIVFEFAELFLVAVLVRNHKKID